MKISRQPRGMPFRFAHNIMKLFFCVPSLGRLARTIPSITGCSFMHNFQGLYKILFLSPLHSYTEKIQKLGGVCPNRHLKSRKINVLRDKASHLHMGSGNSSAVPEQSRDQSNPDREQHYCAVREHNCKAESSRSKSLVGAEVVKTTECTTLLIVKEQI